MSVLINGMEMPTSCEKCRFAIDGFCYASGKVNVSAVEERQVTNYCPLIPVPEHGRLIDADALQVEMEIIVSIGIYGEEDCIDAVIEAPTIIPADPSDKEAGE